MTDLLNSSPPVGLVVVFFTPAPAAKQGSAFRTALTTEKWWSRPRSFYLVKSRSDLKRQRAWRTCLGFAGELELQRDVFEYYNPCRSLCLHPENFKEKVVHR
ncbi:hypothetical protein MVEN_02299400 [Mycena venus]|uniref:Uncharacterized protein n=1 Tax=Mycena venus TaxID=2733690 RepID=A0A8H6X5T7_9AGAR|nr:hypothetical protein MVEN_02299400 [Mycena venus]